MAQVEEKHPHKTKISGRQLTTGRPHFGIGHVPGSSTAKPSTEPNAVRMKGRRERTPVP